MTLEAKIYDHHGQSKGLGTFHSDDNEQTHSNGMVHRPVKTLLLTVIPLVGAEQTFTTYQDSRWLCFLKRRKSQSLFCEKSLTKH